MFPICFSGPFWDKIPIVRFSVQKMLKEPAYKIKKLKRKKKESIDIVGGPSSSMHT